jgi:hypothetical protein
MTWQDLLKDYCLGYGASGDCSNLSRAKFRVKVNMTTTKRTAIYIEQFAIKTLDFTRLQRPMFPYITLVERGRWEAISSSNYYTGYYIKHFLLESVYTV